MPEFYFPTYSNYLLDQTIVITVDMVTHTIVIKTHTPQSTHTHIHANVYRVIISRYTLPAKWLSLAHNKLVHRQHRLLLAWVVQYW